MSANTPTDELFDSITAESRDIFAAKLGEYGPSFTVFRPRSLVDKLWIKGRRIRTLEEVEESRVPEGIRGEYLALINYSAIGLMRVRHPENFPDALDERLRVSDDEILSMYDDVIADAKSLVVRKNHDYRESWRDMHITSITDILLDKIVRLKSTAESEWTDELEPQFIDILNYAVFAVHKLDSA